MNCKQVNKLAFSYVENQLQPHLRRDLECHLQDCYECQQTVLLAQKEEAVLRDVADIPELSVGFTRRIMSAVCASITSGEKSVRSRRRIFSRPHTGQAVTAGLVAAAILVWLVMPEVREQHNTLFGHKPEVKHQMAELPAAPGGTKSFEKQALPEVQNDQAMVLPPTENVKTAPDYSRTASAPMMAGRALKTDAPPQNSAAPVVFKPYYLPEGFKLTRIESEPDNGTTLIYENSSDGFVSLKSLEITDSGQYQNESIRAAGITSPVLYWTVNAGGKSYRLEISGSLPPEELAHIASSVR